MFDEIKRRGLLATVGATLGLAGCGSRESADTPSETGTDSPTQSATRAQSAAAPTDTRQPLPEHDHSGPDAGGGTLAPESLRSGTVEADSVAAERVETGALNAAGLTVGPADTTLGDRPLVSTERRVLSVPGDFETIQAALDEVPLVLRHEYVVAVDDGSYDEHLVVPPVLAGHPKARSDQERSGLEIYGNGDAPERVTANSLTISGCTGAVNPFVSGFTFRRANPYDDEDVAVVAYGTTETSLANLRIRKAPDRSDPIRAAVKSYGGTAMKVAGLDLGDRQVRRGLVTKHHGTILHKEGRITGRVTDAVVWPVGGLVEFNGENVDATADDTFHKSERASFSFDRSTDELLGVRGLRDA